MSIEPYVLIKVTEQGVVEVSLGARSSLEEVKSLRLYSRIRDNIRQIDAQINESELRD